MCGNLQFNTKGGGGEGKKTVRMHQSKECNGAHSILERTKKASLRNQLHKKMTVRA